MLIDQIFGRLSIIHFYTIQFSLKYFHQNSTPEIDLKDKKYFYRIKIIILSYAKLQSTGLGVGYVKRIHLVLSFRLLGLINPRLCYALLTHTSFEEILKKKYFIFII